MVCGLYLNYKKGGREEEGKGTKKKGKKKGGKKGRGTGHPWPGLDPGVEADWLLPRAGSLGEPPSACL